MTRDITIIIPNWNGRHWLADCLEGLEQQTYRQFETVIVDNGSSDGSVEWIRQHAPHVRLIENVNNTGFAAAANAGIAVSEAPLVALLNNDTVPSPSWLEALVSALGSNAADRVGSVASCMVHYDDPKTIENAGDQVTWQGEALKRGRGRPIAEFSDSRDILSACAGAALYRRSFLDKAGGFDADFFAYLEDVDLGMRGQVLGYRCQYVPEARISHKGHGSKMPSATYVRLVTRNRYWLFWKNVPPELRKLHRASILYGSFCFFALSRRPLAWLQGATQAYKRKSEMLAFNRTLWAKHQISEPQFESMLEPRGTLPSFHRREQTPKPGEGQSHAF